MLHLYHVTAQDLIADREHEAEAIRIERLVSRGVDPYDVLPAGPGPVRRAAAALALAISRWAGNVARSLDASVAQRAAR